MTKYGFFVVFLFSLVGCGQKDKAPPLRIAAAANMQFAMDSLTSSFTAVSAVPCEVIISSSGKLTAQILQGAPYDIFLSADMKYPEQLIENQKALGPVLVYAKGSLILWSLQPDLTFDSLSQAIELLGSSRVNHIALANPKTAPYGRAALEVLTRYQLLDQVQDKLVYGESIAQTNQFITTQAAEVGFTSKSVQFAAHLEDHGRWLELPHSDYQAIEQGAVVLRNEKQHPAATAFLEFLQSARAKKILNNFGYSTN